MNNGKYKINWIGMAVTVGSFVVGGMVGGPLGIGVVATGLIAYGAHKKYEAKKSFYIRQQEKLNGGRPLTKKQKDQAKKKVLVDMFSITPPVQAITAENDVNKVFGRVSERVKKTSKEVPIEKKSAITRAFDFDFSKSSKRESSSR